MGTATKAGMANTKKDNSPGLGKAITVGAGG